MKTMVKSMLKQYILLSVVLLSAGSCSRDPFRVDVSGIETNIEIVRFEQDLFTSDPSSVEKNIPYWQEKYGIFFNHFCYVTGIGNTNDPLFAESLRSFISDRSNYTIYKRTMEVFPDMSRIEEELNMAFKYYLHYFPEKTVPAVYTYISGLGESAITDEGLLAIGIDKYLGSNEPIYRQAGIYGYLLKNMHPAKIVSDCMNFWGETEFEFNDSVDNLISHMIYRGMLMYYTAAMLPHQADTLKWGFSGKEMAYLDEYEKSMWAFLIEHKLLFETDRFTIDKFIIEGPFTGDFGRNSPARAAVWIGYRIVEAYMKKNPEITLQKLMQIRDYRNILTLSRYNP